MYDNAEMGSPQNDYSGIHLIKSRTKVWKRIRGCANAEDDCS